MYTRSSPTNSIPKDIIRRQHDHSFLARVCRAGHDPTRCQLSKLAGLNILGFSPNFSSSKEVITRWYDTLKRADREPQSGGVLHNGKSYSEVNDLGSWVCVTQPKQGLRFNRKWQQQVWEEADNTL